MQKRTYHIDFSKKCGRIKPMHGTNLSFAHNSLGDDPISTVLSAHTPPVAGFHDVEHPYGQNQYIDIHCIFPDFTRDADDESAYNFAPTDEYVFRVVNSGAQIIFRLGESTDSYSVKPFLKMPHDIEKWADVCLHVIMHFNAKWASGYKWNIQYFEIWSGADSEDGFLGDVDDYYTLYSTCVRKIKSVFPRIKIGGYSSLGFSAMNRVTDNARMKAAYPFMQKFLSAATSSDGGVAPDFFTWRLCPSSAEELSLHSKYAKSLLREYGLRSCKSIVSEFEMSDRKCAVASDYLSAMITAQKSDIDIMLYKYTHPNREKEIADALYSAIYLMKDAVALSDDYRKELYALAAVCDSCGAVLISSLDFTGAVELFVGGEYSEFDISELSLGADGTYSKAALNGTTIKCGKIVFNIKKRSMYFLTLK